MVNFVYKRDTVPIGENIVLSIQMKDSADNFKDADTTPTLRIIDAVGTEVRAASASSITRLSLGHYRLQFTVPTGFSPGLWNDIWIGAVDGYTLTSVFSFIVDSQGSVDAVDTVVEADVELGDEPDVDWTQAEIININILLKLLKARLRNTAFKPDGSVCNVFADEDLINFLNVSLSEFNMTPTLTSYKFDDPNVVALFADILTQGAMLIAWSGQAILESGREFTITDNGVVIQPPPVSATINTQYSANLVDYRAKLKEIKRNLRPSPRGLGASSIIQSNPAVMRLRHRVEGRIL